MEKEYIAPGGVKIYHDCNTQLHSFCLSLYVKAGSMYEQKEENGISHFFEHIVFRNIHYRMGKNLYQTLDRLGLVFNAITYKEFMVFYITGAPQHFSQAAEILSGVMDPLVLPEEEIDIERRRIKAEIREDDEDDGLFAFSRNLIWKKTSLAWPIAGKKSVLNTIKRKQLSAFQKKILSRDNYFYYVTGNASEDDIAFLGKTVSAYSPTPKSLKRDNVAPVPKRFFHRKNKVYFKKGSKVSVCFGIDVDAQKYSSAERQLLYDVLFDGDFCRVHQALSEEKGYVYSYDSSIEEYRNLAHIRLIYEVQEKNLYASVEEVFRIFASLKEDVGDALEYAKPTYIDNAHFIEDDAEDYNWMMAYENHILKLPYHNIREKMKDYEQVSAERLKQICREVFRSENMVLAVEGKPSRIDLARLKQIRERSF
jgi:predicted Zn-dependent peptidase